MLIIKFDLLFFSEKIKNFLLNYVKYSKIEMLLKHKSIINQKNLIYKKKYRKINLQINRGKR